MHEHTAETEQLASAIYEYAHDQLLMDPPTLDRPESPDALSRVALVNPRTTEDDVSKVLDTMS